MSLHKLTAGDGYTYLTRQVATVDSTERGYSSLGNYYAAKGESPGVWIGSQAEVMGLAGTAVTEQQMKNLFGAGLHPDAQRLEAEALTALPATGDKREHQRTVDRAGKLGAKFPVFQASPAWHEHLAAAYQKYNLNAGLAKGDKVPETAKQAIRTQVGTAMFAAEYGRAPHHEHELSGFVTQQSRPASSAVAGYDVTFSPVKSVSALWAIAPPEVAGQLEAAHNAAVGGTLLWLEKEAGYTREGTGSVSQIRIKGFLATAFTHRDSRAGDPDLHTHVAVSNKVQTPDGRWLSLDARMLYRYNVAASEQYNLLLEKESTQRVGGRFAERGGAAAGKREIRELVGVPPELNEHFSSRRVMIEAHRAELVTKFRADQGRVPTAIELIKLAQQATLATRQAKHEPMSLAEQRALWQSYPDDVCSERPEQILADVTGQSTEYVDITPELLAELTGRVVQTVTGSRAQWRDNNLSAEARRQVKGARIHPDQVEELAEQVTTAAAGLDHSVPIGMDTEIDQGTPNALLDVDGKAVFRVAKGQLFTSSAILDAEARIVAAAGQTDAWALTDADVDIAHLEWSANNEGRTLNTGQLAMVREFLTSGRRLQLVIGPAGAGKTTALAVGALAVQSTGGHVVVLAPTAAAARVAGDAIPGVHADTLHKLAWHLQPGEAPAADVQADPGSAAAAAEQAEKLAWISEIGPHHLVIIDEAGLAGTRELDMAVRHITGVGGRVLLVGDPAQRAANGAGGVLRDIESTHGALMLDEVMRFQDRGIPGAGALHGRATLALRQGDPGAAGYYVDRNLLRAVTPDTACAQVFAGWSADVAAGADSIMIAPTLDMVSDLNNRARTARLAATTGPIGRERDLQRGEKVSAGDLVVTKKNKRVLSMGGTDFVRNNYRWTVQQVNRDGSIIATELTRGLTRTLPAWYVDKGWVRLGYAHTEASVQGMTVGGRDKVGTAHAVFTDSTNRNQLYTSITRATDRTVSYGIIPGTGDSHEVTTPTAISPQTVVEMFAAVIGRDGSDRSATTTLRESGDPAFQLGAPGNAALAYSHAIVKGSLDLVGEQRMQLIADTVEVLIPGVTSAPAWETLRGHLATIEACGGNAARRLDHAARGRELRTAADLAAVLDFRLDRTGNHSLGQGPLPYLPAIPAALAAQPVWDTYLAARANLVADLAQQLRDRAFSWTVEDAPAWAVPYLPDMDLVADLTVWRAARAVPDTDLRPAGPRPLRLTDRTWHAGFTQRAIQVAGDPTSGADRWKQLLTEQHHLDVAQDDWFPVLAARLTLAEAAGLDVPALLAEAIDGHEPLPAQVPAKALWWRLEPRLGSLTADHALPASGHRLRPVWTADLTEAVGELDAERVMSDRLWPTIVAHVDRAIREGHSAALILPAAAGMFSAARPTVAAHEMATVLLWQISTVTDPAPPDPDLEAAYPDPDMDDLLVPAGAHQILDDLTAQQSAAAVPAGRRLSGRSEPAPDAPEPTADPFDPDRHAAAAALIYAAYADLDLTDLAGSEPADEDADVAAETPEPQDERPADLYDAAAVPAQRWTAQQPPAEPVDLLDPDIAPAPELPDPQRQALHDRLYAANAAALQYYREQAPTSWVPAYIAGRALDPDLFGYAPNRYTSLADHLRQAGFTDTELVAAGLVKYSQRGQIIDRFRDRAVLPITTPQGDVAAFIGRRSPTHIDRDPAQYTAPKYVNGPTTDIFTKGDLPYGLNPQSVAALKDGADIVLVEGPMDAEAVMAAAAAQGRNLIAIAPNGTALTAEHLTVLAGIAPLHGRNIIEAFDSDQAGRDAATNAHRLLAAAGVHTADTVTGLTGKDPAEMLADTGPASLLAALDQRRPLTDLVLDTVIAKYDIHDGTVESRYNAMNAVVPVIAALPREEIIDQTIRVAAAAVPWDTDRAIDWVARHIPDTPTPARSPAEPGDLGLPPLPRLTSVPRPHPTTGPTAGGRDVEHGTVLTRPDTDVSVQDQHTPQTSDPTDLQPAAALSIATENLDVTTEAVADPAVHPVDPGIDRDDDTAPAAVASLVDHADVDAVDAAPQAPTEHDAALAWLEEVDPNAHTAYIQAQAGGGEQDKAAAAAALLAQYRNHTAAEVNGDDAEPVDPATATESDILPQYPNHPDPLAAADPDMPLPEPEPPGPYADLPTDVLDEEAGQLAAENTSLAQVAANAAAYLQQIQSQIEQDNGPEVMRVRAQDAANQQGFAAMKEALEASNAADAAQAKAAALGAQVMETEQNLREVRGVFSGGRRAALEQRLQQIQAAHQEQRAEMVALARRNQELTGQLGTRSQQQAALTLRDPDTYRTQLARQLQQARQQDRQEAIGAAEWADTTAQRHTSAAEQLVQIDAEQTHRAEHPDPSAELRRQEIYEQLQADEAEAASWGQSPGWGPDLDLPAAPDNSIER